MTSPLTFNRPQLAKLSRQLGDHTRTLSTTFERLSSGQRIVRPSDDAAGLAIAADLKLDTRVFTQAIRNGNDAISSLSIADAALGELDTVLGRLSELATQSANGAYTLSQRRALDTEANQLVQEYNRIVASTSFNGQSLLTGGQSSTRIQLGYGTDGSLAFTLAEELDTGAGTGTFRTATTSGTTIYTTIGTADFNGDGKTDLVGSSLSIGDISIALSNGDGTFSSSDISFGNHTAIAAGDLDNDGDIDLAISDSLSATTAIYRNNGSGVFSVGGSTTGGSSNLQIADIDGDGNNDLITSSGSNIILKRNTGGGSFAADTVISSLGSTISSLAVGDFNGDGRPDVVTSSSANTAVTTFLNGGGTLTNAGSVTAAAASSRFQVGDINHDGYDDFLGIVSSNVSVSLSSSTGLSSSGLTSLGITSTGSNTQLTDMNGDGYLDIVSKTSTTAVSVFAGTGTGTFGSALGSTTIVNGTTQVGDFNGDGAQDLYVARSASSTFNTHLANTSNTTNIGRLYLLDREGATKAMQTIDAVRDRLTKERGKVGATLSRIGTALSNLSANRLNIETATQRITDADVATESANLVRASIAQNASQALFAQANQNSNILLALLNS